jgi:hypothetical protein
MSDNDLLVRRYLAAWNATDPRVRRTRIEEAFTGDVRYVDPFAAVEGHEALDQLIAAAQGRFPGLVFSPGGTVDAHHDQARFTWQLGPAGGAPLVIGFDVAQFGPDGRIRTVLGFIDQAPPG